MDNILSSNILTKAYTPLFVQNTFAEACLSGMM